MSKAWPMFAILLFQGLPGKEWLMRCGVEESLTKKLYYKGMGRLKEATRDGESPRNSMQQGAVTTRGLKKQAVLLFLALEYTVAVEEERQ